MFFTLKATLEASCILDGQRSELADISFNELQPIVCQHFVLFFLFACQLILRSYAPLQILAGDDAEKSELSKIVEHEWEYFSAFMSGR